MKLEEYAPGEIEKRSFAIIEEELGRELDPVQKPIIKRVIHTTADFSRKERWRKGLMRFVAAFPS